MSKPEDKPEEKLEDKPEEQTDNPDSVIDVNVALLMADNEMLTRKVDEQEIIIEELTKKLSQATDLIDADTKHRLVADIRPKTSVPDDILSKLPFEKLLEMKRVLDQAVVPSFQSGTPLTSKDRSPRAKLASMHDEYMEKLRSK